MPNGDPKWEKKVLPKLEEFFKKISNVLEDFASTHNLFIEKYFRQMPLWMFTFQHPKGGKGQIVVEKINNKLVIVRPCWWIDDFDNSTRSLQHIEGKECSLDLDVLRAVLEEMFKLVLTWQKKDLTPVKHKYNEWKKHPKEMIEGDVLKYPIPKLD